MDHWQRGVGEPRHSTHLSHAQIDDLPVAMRYSGTWKHHLTLL